MVKPVYSLKELEWILGVPRAVLQELAATVPSHYHPFEQRQGKKLRKIDNPDEQLKHVQKRINQRVFRNIEMPDHVHGGVRGRSPCTNVATHLGQRCLIRLDIKDFFPSITPRHVFSVWREQLGFGTYLSSLLTKLTTYRFRLPQGAPTSTALANLVLLPIESVLLDRAAELGVTYSRFVDDMGFSGDDPRPLLQPTAVLLRATGLRINRKKLAGGQGIMGRSKPQLITGYYANCASGPSVPSKKRNNIRVAIHALRHFEAGSAKHTKALERVAGRINWVKVTNPGSASSLRRYLARELGRNRNAVPITAG